MRVLGAVDTTLGRTRHERILNVAAMTFLDEEGNARQFTCAPSKPGSTATKTTASPA